jgi:hypothetical protein
MKKFGKRRRTFCRSASNPSRAAFCLRVMANDQGLAPKRLNARRSGSQKRVSAANDRLRLNATSCPSGGGVNGGANDEAL